jgi:pimeloyl-ACP methyl ester carboxylesterase
MPFVGVSTPSDRIELHYRTNNPLEAILENARPTLLFLNGGMLSSEFTPQFNDPSMQCFNLIALDFPTFGKTKTPLFGSKEQAAVLDDWARAASVLATPPLSLFLSFFFLCDVRINKRLD